MSKLIMPPLPKSPMLIDEVMTVGWQNFFWNLFTKIEKAGIVQLVPKIDYITQAASGKPTQISRGVHKGFSMPVYSADNEELFLQSIIPSRWDEADNIEIALLMSLSGAEDVGDKFKFQVSWDRVHEGDAVVDTSVDVEVETTIIAGGSAIWSTYLALFTIDYDTANRIINVGDFLSWRLRRITASSLEVSNEVVVWTL